MVAVREFPSFQRTSVFISLVEVILLKSNNLTVCFRKLKYLTINIPKQESEI